jgi:hypothetical protein
LSNTKFLIIEYDYKNNINIYFLLANNHHQQRSEPSTAASSTPAAFPEDAIKHITKSGFTRDQAIEELRLTNGDATKALVSLMAKSLSMPKRKR